MARTRVWATEEANYTDATLATSIDNKGTELRADIREVVNQLIGVTESTALADPVVNQSTHTNNALATAMATVTPLVATQTYARHYSALGWVTTPRVLSGSTGSGILSAGPIFTPASGYVTTTDLDGNGTAEPIVAFRDLDLPVGVTVTELTGYFWRTNGSQQMDLTVYRTDVSNGTTTSLGTVTSAGSTTGSMQTVAMSLVDFTTAAGFTYFMTVTGGVSGGSGFRFYSVKADYTSPTANVRL